LQYIAILGSGIRPEDGLINLLVNEDLIAVLDVKRNDVTGSANKA
jgi:hypothetical protein